MTVEELMAQCRQATAVRRDASRAADMAERAFHNASENERTARVNEERVYADLVVMAKGPEPSKA